MQDYEGCVDAGVTYLETYAPHGFKERLIEAHQAGKFDLRSVSECVLAHAFPDNIDGDVIPGHYLTVLEDQNLNTPGTPESYGFVWEGFSDWQELQAAWERRIAGWQEDQVPA